LITCDVFDLLAGAKSCSCVQVKLDTHIPSSTCHICYY